MKTASPEAKKHLVFFLLKLLPPHPSPLPAGERDGVRGSKIFFLFDVSQLCCGVIYSLTMTVWYRLYKEESSFVLCEDLCYRLYYISHVFVRKLGGKW
jgi:hypothetical protein